MTELIEEYYDADIAKLNALARKSAERAEKLKAENAKLRELCERAAIELCVNGNVTDAATKNLFDDMRELGIEVG